MANLPYFSTVAELEEFQGTFWLSTNALLEVLANKMAALLAVTITAADVTLTAAQCQNAEFIRVTGALTGNKNLIVETPAKFYTVSHEGTGNHTVTVKTASGSGVAIDQGTVVRVYCDGTDVVPAAGVSGSGGNAPYDFGFFVDGLVGDGAIVMNWLFVRAVRLPQDLLNSLAVAAVAPSDGDAVFDIQQSGVSIGDLTFPNGLTDGVFTFSADVDFASGDFLTVIAPSPADSTLSGVTVTFAGIRL